MKLLKHGTAIILLDVSLYVDSIQKQN